MARHNLAERSLRHLRFVHRLMVSQPLLARASHISHPPTAVVLDGHRYPLGRILRHLLLNDATWAADGAKGEMNAGPLPEVATPAETWLRLLPQLPETDDINTTSVAPEGDVGALPVTTRLSRQTHARHVDDGAPPAQPIRPAVPPTRVDGLRPRSRIIELPGTVSLPVEEPITGEPGAPDIREESPDDVPVRARAESVADAHETAESEPEQQPLIRESDERITTSSLESAQMATEHVTPVPPAERGATPRRRGRQPSATPSRASDALFPPTDADRSPAAWLARLQHAEEPAPPDALTTLGNEFPSSAPGQHSPARGSRKGATRAQVSTIPTPDAHPSHTPSGASTATPAPEQSSPEEQPSPLPDSSRTLLHTLTGVDPASVRVYRGPVAERATAAQDADALTDGGAIALGAGHATDTPETLGLLAHELTHIARRHSPRFVPPVSQTPPHQHRANAETTAPLTRALQLADEEAQARQVEARVTRVARAKPAPPRATQPELTVEPDATTQPAREMSPRPATRPAWGNLPAPWEPLPDWMTSSAEPPVGTPQATPQSAPQPQPQPQSQPSLPAPARAPSATAPGTQRAERGRSLPVDAEELSPAHTQEAVTPEPDLDQLAQQVHAILKRRLAAERRRIG